MEAQITVEEAATTATVTQTAVLGGCFIFNLIFALSLNQLWGAINGLQLMVYMPLFWVKFPANANSMNNHLITIANFEVLPSTQMANELYVFPETKPFNINFQQATITGMYAVPNLGTVFYVILIFSLLVGIERRLVKQERGMPHV